MMSPKIPMIYSLLDFDILIGGQCIKLAVEAKPDDPRASPRLVAQDTQRGISSFASTRPARLHSGQPQDVLEDAPGFSAATSSYEALRSITKQPMYLANSNSGSDAGMSVPWTKGR